MGAERVLNMELGTAKVVLVINWAVQIRDAQLNNHLNMLSELSTSFPRELCKLSREWLRSRDDVTVVWGRGSTGRSGRGLFEM